MSGDSKIWLRLPAPTLAAVDQRRGQQNRSEALRALIDRGLASSPTPGRPSDIGDSITIQVTRSEAWAVQMAAWFLEFAAATGKPMGGANGLVGWVIDAPTSNTKEWSAWATVLRELRSKLGGDE